MSKKIVLSGYFGFDNLGDEAILYSIIQEVKKMQNTEITVLSANPEKTSKKFGVAAVDRMSPKEVIRAIKNCDMFISGGGSLLQDVTSNRSLLYYLALLRLAKLFGKKVMIYSQGIGPVNGVKNRKSLAKAFKNLDIINVRDKESYEELMGMGVKKPISITADTVFLLQGPDREKGKSILGELMAQDESLEKLLEAVEAATEPTQESEKPEAITIGIAIRPWKDLDEKIILETKKTIEKLQEIKEYPIKIVFLPFHHPGDLTLSQAVYDSLDNKTNVYVVKNQLDEREMLSLMANVDIILSMRLHGLIFGVVGGAYPVAISYDPKIDSLMKELGLKKPMGVENMDSKLLVEQLEESIKNIKALKEETKELAELMQKRAQEGIELIKEGIQ